MRGSLPRIANQETENPISISEFLKIRLESCSCTRGDYIHLVEGGNTRERLQQSSPRVPKSSRRQLMARLRYLSHLPKSVWSLGYCRLAFLTLSSSHFDPELTSRRAGPTSAGCDPVG